MTNHGLAFYQPSFRLGTILMLGRVTKFKICLVDNLSYFKTMSKKQYAFYKNKIKLDITHSYNLYMLLPNFCSNPILQKYKYEYILYSQKIF